jgi:pyruvate, water dikinase
VTAALGKTMDRLIALSTDPAAVDGGRFGPKAANQAALGQAGLPIPDGFALDAEAYRLQLNSLGLEAAVRNATSTDFMAARRDISRVRIALFEAPICPAVLRPLRRAYRELVEAPGAPVVVRSSALLEDSAGASFAGQFQTFLGLQNEADFLTAIRACWGALWSSRALKYMASHDVSPADTAMAVLVQPLVDAQVSGGGMSRTADGGMLVSATWGLGEPIAQGEVVPDRYDLSRAGDLIETAVGRKDHSIHCVHHHAAPSSQAVSEDLVSEPCLNQARLRELADMMTTAEDLMGAPVEIEWAMDDDGIKLLQARPLHVQPAPVPDEIWLRHPGVRGHPGGVGWGTGRACVINCECEIGRVAPGDVLVTRVAGPALAQVLTRVSGVVAELGGSTSHLASLARERGIPMVLGVPDATSRIPDRSQVGVDGVAGIVRWFQ